MVHFHGLLSDVIVYLHGLLSYFHKRLCFNFNSQNFHIFYKQVLERLGINNKKNCNRLAGMWSRFGMNIQPEMHQKAKTYRFWTSVEHNSESANPFLNKSENANENKITDLYIGSSDALDRSGQSQTRSAYDCSTLKGDTAGSRNMKIRYINTEPSGGSPRYSESNHMLLCPGNPQPLFLEPKDTTCDSKLSLLSTVEINGASLETPPAALKPLGSGSDPRYPCLSLTEDSTRREKRILERLQVLVIIHDLEALSWPSFLSTCCILTTKSIIFVLLSRTRSLF